MRTVAGHALRDAAARGRLDAGPGRGRRRRPVRAQVPRRRPGPEGAASPSSSPASSRARPACRCPRSCSSSSIPQLGARRARPGDPGADRRERRAQRRARLPARLADLSPRRRARARPGARGRDRLARRADDQRRPHAAEPEPAALARPAVADRPRRRALPPARLGGPAGRRAPRRSRRSATTCCCRARAASRRPTRGWRRGSTPRRRRARRRRSCPDDVVRARASAPQYVEYLCRRLEAPRGFAAEAEEARRAAGASPFQYAIVRVVPRVERGECVNAGVVAVLPARAASSPRAIELDEARLRALAPDADLDGDPRRTSTRSRGSPRATRRRADRRAAGVGALPLARRAVEHDHPDLARAHRADRGPRGASSSASPPGSWAEPPRR